MRPYYQRDGVAIYCGDCREFQMIGDAIVTDPPYGQTSLAWDRWPTGWLALAGKSLWMFGTLRMFMEHSAEIAEHEWKLSQDLIWEKQNGSSFHTDRFRRVHEQPAHFYRGAWNDVFKDVPMTMDARPKVVRRKERPAHMGQIENSTYRSVDGGPRLERSVIYARSMHGSAIHETEKPIEILAPLIQYSTPVGATVLDPFCGSGAVLEAAVRLGRKAIGIEVRESVCEQAAIRLQNMLPSEMYSGIA